MDETPTKEWDENRDGTLSIESIRGRYPKEGYRISESRYQPGEKFDGAMRSGSWYIINGSCRVHFDGDIILRKGDVREMPEGSYSLEVLGSQELHIAVAWKLPPPFKT